MIRANAVRILSVTLLTIVLGSFSTLPARESTPAMQTAISWVDQDKAAYKDLATFIWENPELSLVEFKSSARLQQYLAANGFKIEKSVAGMSTAFVATWGSGLAWTWLYDLSLCHEI